MTKGRNGKECICPTPVNTITPQHSTLAETYGDIIYIHMHMSVLDLSLYEAMIYFQSFVYFIINILNYGHF